MRPEPRRWRIASLSGVGALAGALWSTPAEAYPWMIHHGYTSCAQCHVDPSGGGVLTAYGRAQGEILLRTHFQEAPENPGKVKDFLFGAVPLPETLMLQADVRGLVIPDPANVQAILMQADARAAFQTKLFLASASLGAVSKGAEAARVTSGADWNLVAREYWVGVTPNKALTLRAGRMNLPFGLRTEDHIYRIGIDIYTTLWDDPTGACVRQRVADSGYKDVLVGSATTLEPREVIDESGCENCHTVIEFHGSGRIGVNYCIMCHTVGAEDKSTNNPTTQADFPNMIHKIHGSSTLDNGYCFNSTCFDVSFPRQDGGVAACTACHGDNTEWQDPTTRGCITCHDSTDAAAHAAINTNATYGESCAVCHGPGREFSAKDVHAFDK